MEKLFTAPCTRTHRTNCVVTLLGVLIAMMVPMDCLAKGHVLIYTKNGKGYIHDNIAASVKCLKDICNANGWTFEATDDAAVFNTPDKVKTFDVLVFSNTNNETFDNDDQRKVFQNYIRAGGAFVAIHSACGSERNWPWFWANLGGKFVYHPPLQKFDIAVIDKNHPSTAHLPDIWEWEDEFYVMNELNPRITVLLAGDLRTVTSDRKDAFPGRVFGDYYPLAWYQQFDGGRQWYTTLGHKIEYYQNANFIKHLEGGLRWAMNKVPAEAKPPKKAD